MAEKKTEQTERTPEEKAKEKARIENLARETLSGKHGVGEARKKSLGKDYEEVQKEVLRARARSGR